MDDPFVQTVVCYVALGSNLGDSNAYLDKAVLALQKHKAISGLISSRYYKSKPHGPQDQPDYFNAVVKFNTRLKPEKLLDLLQDIENKNKRVRKGVVRWGARTLDLDLLFYGNERINTKRLTVPHPRICERAFVLLPLNELASGLKVTKTTTINDCIDTLTKKDLSDCIAISKE